MKVKSVLYTILLFCTTTACEDAIQKPLMSQDLDLLVVTGVFTSENINHLITLSHPYTTQNGTPLPASRAMVNILEGNNIYPLTESPVGSGQYYTAAIAATTGKTYSLSILYQSHTYVAQDSPVPVEGMDSLQYMKTDDLFSLILNPSTSQGANYISHNISWVNTPACSPGADCQGKIVYYDLKTTDVNEIFKPDKAPFEFPLNSIVIRKKYSLSPAYKAYLRAVLSETEWSGGIFDVQRANVPTNLSEGAIGFFAVSTVVADTTIVVEKP